MRRMVASTLLVMLAAAFIVPVATATLSSQPRACCRANGSHHCFAPAQSSRSIGGRCPYSHSLVLNHSARPASSPLTPSAQEAHPFIREFVPDVRSSDEHDRQTERGPPQASSSR